MKRLTVTFLFFLSAYIGYGQVNSNLPRGRELQATTSLSLNKLKSVDLSGVSVLERHLNFYPSNLKTAFKLKELPKLSNYDYANNDSGVPAITLRTKSKGIGVIKIPFSYLR